MNDISQSRDAASATASTLLASTTRADFVVAMVVLNRVLLITKQLSVSLQEVNKDLAECLTEVEQVANLLQKMRDDGDSVFAELAHEADELLSEPLQLPRVCGHQKQP